MRLEWLIALLRPEDIAMHPNLPDGDYDALPQAALAAVVLGDPRRIRPTDDFLNPNEEKRANPFSHWLVEGAMKSFRSATIHQGASELSRHAAEPECDIAQATSATLLATCALSELEQHQDALDLLNAMLVRVEPYADSNEGTLLRLVLLLQICLRMRDWGSNYSDILSECRDLLDILDTASSFDVSLMGRAATGSSTNSVKHIVAALRYSVWSFEPIESRSINIEKFLRYPRSEQLLMLKDDAADEYAATVVLQFKQLFGDSSIQLGGGSAPDLFYVNLRYELLGSSQALWTRRQLALHRLVKGRSMGEQTDYAECVRLLRYSANSDGDLDRAISGIRLAGPLAALSHDVRQVILWRLNPHHVRYAELAVVRAAAELLTPHEASSALDQLFRLIEAGCPYNVVGRWTAYSRRLQDTWRAATQVAKYSNRLDELAALLLDKIGESPSDDETLDRAYAWIARDIDWDDVSAQHKASWSSWANAAFSAWPYTVGAVRGALNERVARWDASQDVLTVTQVAEVLNDAARGRSLPEKFIDRAVGTVSNSLKQLQAASKKGGPFGMGGVEPAACAVGLIDQGATDLWDPLADFLRDSRIPRSYRSAGFDYLVDVDITPPAAVLDAFRLVADDLIAARDSLPMAGEDIIPYPSALRFLAKYRVLDQSSLPSNIIRLAGSSDLSSRIEAARSLAVLAATVPESWMAAIAIQLSHDQNGEILGYCSNALAFLLHHSDDLAQATSNRLLELLRSDGMIAPLLALRGLRRNRHRLTRDIDSEIYRLADNHPSRVVRDEAATMLIGET